VERGFAWTARFRRLARDFERTPETFRSLHFIACAIVMLHNYARSICSCPLKVHTLSSTLLDHRRTWKKTKAQDLPPADAVRDGWTDEWMLNGK